MSAHSPSNLLPAFVQTLHSRIAENAFLKDLSLTLADAPWSWSFALNPRGMLPAFLLIAAGEPLKFPEGVTMCQRPKSPLFRLEDNASSILGYAVAEVEAAALHPSHIEEIEKGIQDYFAAAQNRALDPIVDQFVSATSRICLSRSVPDATGNRWIKFADNDEPVDSVEWSDAALTGDDEAFISLPIVIPAGHELGGQATELERGDIFRLTFTGVVEVYNNCRGNLVGGAEAWPGHTLEAWLTIAWLRHVVAANPAEAWSWRMLDDEFSAGAAAAWETLRYSVREWLSRGVQHHSLEFLLELAPDWNPAKAKIEHYAIPCLVDATGMTVPSLPKGVEGIRVIPSFCGLDSQSDEVGSGFVQYAGIEFPLTPAPRDREALRRALVETSPQAAEFAAAIARDNFRRRALWISPTILVGPAGCGKSTMLKALGQVTGAVVEHLDLAGDTPDGMLGGTDRSWRGAKPCHPVIAITSHNCGNPVFAVEEIDKVGTSTQNGSPIHLLEAWTDPMRAGRYYDRFLMAPVNLSACSWIMTANTLSNISPTLQSRCRIIHIAPPSIGMAVNYANKMLLELCGGRDITEEEMNVALYLDTERDALVSRWMKAGGGDLRALRRIVEDDFERRIDQPVHAPIAVPEMGVVIPFRS